MKTNTHPVSQETLMAYLDGELIGEETERISAHVEACRECQDLAADLQAISRRLLEWQVEATDLAAPQATDIQAAPCVRFFSIANFRWAWAVVPLLILSVGIALFRLGPSAPEKKYLVGYSATDRQISPRLFARKQFLAASESVRAPAPPPLTPPRAPVSDAGPLIARTAELSLVTSDFEKSRGDIDRVLAAFHGYLAHLSVISPPDRGHLLEATLKVPAAQLDSVLGALKTIGQVDSESQTGEEVTRQVVDVTARLANSRNTEQRLTQILRDRTGKLSDVLAVEEQIDIVRGQIEQMQAEQESLAHRIAFANVDLKITEEYRAPLASDTSSISTRLRNAAVKGIQNVMDAAIEVLLFLLAYGPLLVIIAALAFFPARILWRRRRATD
ncbi:MAG: DUF4349 domain-containing protein [Acidobacteriaceae bacterium]|nr:DUF4349 domain-containing protein [Acidobacteriaceae bacterium]